MCYNMRGIYTPWAIPGIPSTFPPPSAKQATSRLAFLRKHAILVLILYLILDLQQLLQPEHRLLRLEKRHFFTALRQGLLTAEDVAVRVVSTLSLAIIVSAIVQLYYSCAALLVVGVGLQGPESWPDLWGNWRDGRTLRGFWG